MAAADKEWVTPNLVRNALGEGLVNTVGDDLTNLMFMAGFLRNPLAMGGILGGVYGLRQLFGGKSPEEKLAEMPTPEVRPLDEVPELKGGMMEILPEPVGEAIEPVAQAFLPGPAKMAANLLRGSTPHQGGEGGEDTNLLGQLAGGLFPSLMASNPAAGLIGTVGSKILGGLLG